MPWTSTAPAAIAALVAAFSQIPLNGEVRDGPATDDADALEVITVGYVGPDDDASAEDHTQTEGLAGMDREGYDVHCAVAVLAGDESGMDGVPVVRARCFELLAACRRPLIADPRLGGAVMKAAISSWALREDMTTGGAYARIRFDVSIDAFANR